MKFNEGILEIISEWISGENLKKPGKINEGISGEISKEIYEEILVWSP